MNYIEVSNLRAGQTFTQPVYIEGDTVFIPAGVPVRAKDLERLRSWKVDRVETEGMLVLADPEEFVIAPEDTWGIPADDELFHFYINTIDKMDEVLARIRNFERVTETEIEEIAYSLIKTVEDKKVDAVRLVLTNSSNYKSYAKSAVNGGLLAVTVGISLNRPRHKLSQLCSGALLHDAGMQRVPQEIVQQDRALKAKELEKLKAHSVYSYRIINKELQLPEEVAQIALQHHERWDGGGYPRGLKSTEIMLEARIVSVADAFEAMVSERPWRNSMIGYEAMRSILSDNQRRFDPEIVKVFIRAMGLYPVGSLVLLSDGGIGRVISSSEDAPLRPEVIILIDSSGKEHKGDTGPVVDLLSNKSLFIARALDIRSLIEKTKS